MTNMEIASTIIEQLGGRRFSAMTGAKNYVAIENGVQFRLPGAGGFCRDGINYVKVTLDANDTYSLKFSRIRKLKETVVNTMSGVYCDMLAEMFEEATGLRTHL